MSVFGKNKDKSIVSKKERIDNNVDNYMETMPKKPREFGEIDFEDERFNNRWLIVGFVSFIVLSAIFVYFIPKALYAVLISYGMLFIIYLYFNYFIKIPMCIVLATELSNDKLIDNVGIYYIPQHMIHSYEIIGNIPPLKMQSGDLIYIADKFDKENKVIHMAYDERFSNLRFLVFKGTFLDLKKDIIKLANLVLRQKFTQDISVKYGVLAQLDKYAKAQYDEPELHMITNSVDDRAELQKRGLDGTMLSNEDILEFINSHKDTGTFNQGDDEDNPDKRKQAIQNYNDRVLNKKDKNKKGDKHRRG